MKLLRSLLFALALAAGSTLAAGAAPAVPSIHDVYTAATTGHLNQARGEIDQVLAAYPNSAKARFVSARIAALQGRWQLAASELAKARSLDPGLSFEHRDTLQAFTRQVDSHVGRAAAAAPTRRGLPLGTLGIALAGLALLVLWAVYRASRRPQPMPQAWPAPAAAYPAGYAQPGAAPMPGGYAPGAGTGSGILGAVGTGLAMGAGVAAGEMLVDKLFDPSRAAAPGWGAGDAAQADAGALPDDQDFGVSDAGSWSDDSSDSGGWN